jgi:Mrp family chromosome partitioning ATPase
MGKIESAVTSMKKTGQAAQVSQTPQSTQATQSPQATEATLSKSATAIRRRRAELSDLSQYPLRKPAEKVLQQKRVLGLTPSTSSGFSAYRMIRTRLLQVLRSNKWQTLAIVSAGMAEGKSLTAINLALSLSREGNQNVFLVDLDMRRPKLGEYLGIKHPHGVQQYFEGQTDAKSLFFRIGAPGLAIAVNTAVQDNSSELLSSERLAQLIEYVQSVDPDAILLFDMPPLLLADDAIAIAPSVDGIILVACEGKTRRADLATAFDLIKGFGLAGVILNKSAEQVAQYY